jgi:hypothetical protein
MSEKGTLLQVYGEDEPLKITYTAPKNGESSKSMKQELSVLEIIIACWIQLLL